MEKSLGLGAVFSIAAGAMISSGLFVLPGIVFALSGPSIFLAYLVAAVLYIPALCAQAELSTAMPRSGGSYFSVERSLGAFIGTVAGLSNWLAISLKAAFACVGIGSLALLLVPAWGNTGVRVAAAVSCLLFTLLNMVTVKGTGMVQNLLVAALVLILALFVFAGVPAVDPVRFKPFFAGGPGSFLTVVGMVFVSYGGLTKVVDVAEEVDRPGRNVPLGMGLAFLVVNVLYAGAVFVTVGVLPAKQLAGNLAPIADTARILLGPWGAILVSVAAFFAYATTGNAGILSASRSPEAMSRDGLMPEALAHRSKRFKTPTVSLAVTCTVIILVVSFLSVEALVKAASTILLVSFVLANLAVIVMRKSNLQGYRPTFRMPLVPWLPGAAIVIYFLLIAEMGIIPVEEALGFLALAALWYITYVHYRIDRESAVVYLAKKAITSNLERSGLEDELVGIALERERVEQDRFDRLVAEATVFDPTERMDARTLFKELSDVLAPQLGMEAKEVYELFIAREAESSTVILPGLAIPHIIVPGEKRFQMTLVRSREGIVFSDLNPPVKTLFVLMGSMDERNFHLKALVAIAHVVQNHDFGQRWFEAQNADQLRDVVLLARRKRG